MREQADWLEKIKQETKHMLAEIAEKINLKTNGILILGGSSSEILGAKIGSCGSLEIGNAIVKEMQQFIRENNQILAVQCCEHLNRALVVEQVFADKCQLEIVSAVPVVNAGGAFATSAYQLFEQPVLVEYIRADYGIDIGNTFIGMHLKNVVVPVRLNIKKIGSATVNVANTRPKFIGGSRAIYK